MNQMGATTPAIASRTMEKRVSMAVLLLVCAFVCIVERAA
jgi:hypothetical protein